MQIRATEEFIEWLEHLRDRQGRARILIRLLRFCGGNPGKSRNLGGGLFELKMDFGAGYRVYFLQRGTMFVLLLCGGDKSTQTKDIERARLLADQWRDVEESNVPQNGPF
jgi:putative addiction module killer protein